MSKRKSKAGATSVASAVADAPVDPASLTRDEMIAILSHHDPSVAYEEEGDDELRMRLEILQESAETDIPQKGDSAENFAENSAAIAEPEVEEVVDDEDVDLDDDEDEDVDDVDEEDLSKSEQTDPEKPVEVSVEDVKIPENASPEAAAVIQSLRTKILALKAASESKKIASGSKARPNVVYTLLAKPPAWHSTPQVAQIEKILFGQEKRQLSEPELFDLIKDGKDRGILRTSQNPVRIFQYYRSELIKKNVLVMK